MINRLFFKIDRLEIKNPFIPASGCFGYGEEAKDFYDIDEWGCILTKTITLEPREGNRPPRILETPSGLLNSIGLANPGIEKFITEILPQFQEQNSPLMVSIAGNSFDDYWKLAEQLETIKKVNALEVNISCPNIKKGGIAFGTDPEMVKQLIKGIKDRYTKVIITKLTPNVSSIIEPALAAEEAGSHGLTLSNTYLGMAIDIRKKRPVFHNIQAGLSGPAIKPMALLKVYQVYKKVKIPIIASGGINDINDCIEFFLAGASAIQLGSALFKRPALVISLKKQLEDYLEKNNYVLSDLIGKAH